MKTVDASRVKEIIERYSVLLKDGHVHFKDDIPEEKLKNATEKYADIPYSETPLLLIDNTLLGSGKDGAVFTGKRVFGKVFFTKGEIPYNSINSAELVDTKIFINSKWLFSVIHVDESNRLKVCNMIREIIGMEPQKAIISGKELKKLRKKNKSLKRENEHLKERIPKLKKANFMPPEGLAQLRAELREIEEKCANLEGTIEEQKQKIETVQPELRAALEKCGEEKGSLQQEVETLQQHSETLEETLQKIQFQRQKALNSLTPEERYIYHYIVRQKGTINIHQLMNIKKYSADDIFTAFAALESKGFISRIVEELYAGRRFTSKE